MSTPDRAAVHRLFAFGTLGVDSNGAECDALLRQPKRAALLCYLVLARPSGFHRRDTLVELFWPESDQLHARASLRQAVHLLRRFLGEDALLRRGDEELAIDHSCWWSDVEAFEDAVEHGRFEDALHLYRGDLLSGLHVTHAPAFEHWLDAEQLRLRQLAAGAARQLFHDSATRRDTAAAVTWAHRLFAVAPEEEDVARRLITLLDDAGDPAAAVREYERFAQQLRAGFEIEPVPETQQLAAEIRARASARVAVVPKTGDAAPSGPAPVRRRSVRRVAASLVVALVVLMLAGALALSSREPAATVDASVLAIFPFRVHSADSSLSWLGEGVADLAETRLAAEASMAVVGLQTTLAAWQRSEPARRSSLTDTAARRIARQLGAGRLLLGTVVGDSRTVTLSASLLETTGGTQLVRATVSGTPDSLTALVGRLAAQLLSLEAGEDRDRLAALTSTSLPALRAYLDGTAALRRGRAERALEHFERALDEDSLFALAALGMHRSLGIGFTRYSPDQARRAARLAWARRDVLPIRDQLLLRARLGSRYPDWTPLAEQVAFVDSAAAALRTVAGLWFELGSAVFHHGAHLEIDDFRTRALDALQHALHLDPSYTMARVLALEILIEARDSGGMHAMRASRDSAPNPSGAWLASVALADDPAGTVPLAFDSWGEQELRRVIIGALSYGAGLGVADRAADILLRRAANRTERDRTLLLARELAMNRGRTADATRMLDELAGPGRPEWYRRERMRDYLYYALYWDGDEAAAARIAAELERRVSAGVPAAGEELHEQLRDLCVLEQWRLDRGLRASSAATIARLRGAAARLTDRAEAARAESCAAMLEAVAAAGQPGADLPRLVQRFETLHQVALPRGNEAVWYCAGNLVAARLHELHGDRAAALRALRRHGAPGDRKILLSTVLREEARLTAAAGDTLAARRLLRHYQALRPDAAAAPDR